MGTAVVVGAGIGGLAVAAALTGAGHEAIVVERAPELVAVGAGLTLQPNAVLALRRLGISDAIEAVGATLSTVTIRDAGGRVLSGLSRRAGRRLEQQVGAPALGIHRATLQQALLDACSGVSIRLDTRVVGVADGAVLTSDGSHIEGDIVVGADGLRSVVRRAMVGEVTPVYSGYTCWRGVTDRAGQPDGWSGEYWGRGRRFGGCAIDGGRLYWFAVADAPPGGIDDQGAHAAAVECVATFPRHVRRAVEVTPADAVFRTDISDIDPLPVWGQGPVTLLGDAAHAMTPNLGQGACQAIEDALALRDDVVAGGLIPESLRSYEARRRTRVTPVMRAARLAGRVAQASNPAAVMARDTLTRLTPPRAYEAQLRRSWTLPQ